MDKILKLARLAAMATPGVSRLSSPIDVLAHPGQLKIDVDVLEVYVIVKADVKIPEVAWDLQTNIMKALKDEGITTIERINIHVQGVDYKEE